MKKTAKSWNSTLKKTKGIKKVSDDQKKELALRAKVKLQLIIMYGEHCMTCGDMNKDWRGISLSHKIALSRGGKTNYKNCLLECGVCHDKYEKKPELRPSGNITEHNIRG